MTDHSGSATYADLLKWSCAAESWLRGNGVREGDRVVLRLSASRQYVALLFGAVRLGAVVVPVSRHLSAFQLQAVLDDCVPRLIVVDERESALPHRWLSAARSVNELTGLPEAAGADGAAGEEPQAAVVARRSASPWSDQPTLLMYTSGSTGVPRGVVCTHAQVAFLAQAVGEVLGYRRDDTVFSCIPLSFDYGLHQIFLSTSVGARLVLADSFANRHLLRELLSAGATVVPIVPTLATALIRLAGQEAADHRVRLITNTGEPLSAQQLASLRKAFPGVGIVSMYGLTECKRVSVSPVDADLRFPGTAGLPLPGTTVEIIDEQGLPLPPGRLGQIVVRGPHVMAGYWRAPEATRDRFRGSGAGRTLYTGDFGHFDKGGHLHVVGRRDGIFKIRGVRVSTREIETAALDIPAVTSAVAFPPTADRGPALCVASGGSEQHVREKLIVRLGAGKMPEVCLVLDELPINPHGKVDRQGLLSRLDGHRAIRTDPTASRAVGSRDGGPRP